MSETKKIFFMLLILSIFSFLPFLYNGAIIPAASASSVFLDPGGVSSYLENASPAGSNIFFRIAMIAILVFGFRKKSFSSVFPLSAIVLLLPLNGEALALPFIAACSLGPLWASILFALILPFFSKLAIVAIFFSFLIRFLLNGEKTDSFSPLFGFLSPPLAAAIFKGELFLPFLLSACSFPQYSPVLMLSPLFALFLLAALWLFIDEEYPPIKIIIALASFLFSPLAGISLIYPLSRDDKKFKLLKFAFILPIIIALAFPQKREKLPEGFKEMFSSLKRSEFKIYVPPKFYDEACFYLERKDGKDLYPRQKTRDLAAYYGSLPLKPPFLGYETPGAEMVMTDAGYPKTSSLRPLKAGWKLLRCEKKYVLFAKESFLKSDQNLKPLINYSPYSPLPPEEEKKKLALKEVQGILFKNDNFYEALRDAGRLYLDLNDPQKAEESIRKAIKIKKNAEIYNDLGVALSNLGRYDEAMEAYRSAMRVAPRDIYPRMNYASTALMAGKTEEAVMVLEDVVRAYPTFYPAARFLSQIYGKEGNVEKAKEVLSGIPKEMRTQDENDFVGER